MVMTSHNVSKYGFETITLASFLRYDDHEDPCFHLDLLVAVRLKVLVALIIDMKELSSRM
jgi:hypothetical protein